MLRLIAFCALLAGFVGQASAGVIFHTSSATFDPAVAALVALGGEDFESSTLAPASIQQFNDPLAPGVANGPFPTGTNTAIGMTVQSNTLGGTPTAPSPRGVNSLVTASAGYFGTPDDQVSTVFAPDSLDLIFASPVAEPIVAVDLIPLFFDSINFDPLLLGDILIQVFDTTNSLLGSTTVTGVDYVNEVAYVGVVTTLGDTIGRINLWDGDATNHWQGVDDIRVYAAQPTIPPGQAPTPGTLLLMMIGILGMGVRKRS